MKLSLAEFSGHLTAMEVFAHKGDLHQLREVSAELIGEYRQDLRDKELSDKRLKEKDRAIFHLRRQLAKLSQNAKISYSVFESSLITFEKFRTGITLVQKMRSFEQLPEISLQIRSLLGMKALGLVLDGDEYGDFVPREIRTKPHEEIKRTLDKVFFQGKERKSFIGKVREMGNAVFFLGESLGRQTIIADGSWFICPLLNKYDDKKITGILTFFDIDPNRYSGAKGTDFLEHFSDVLAWSIVTVGEHERLDREKTIDSLTGIHNRAYLHRHAPRILDFAERKDFPVYMLFIDLNGFKKINDTLGHDAGDILLVEVSQRINNMVRQYDIFVRLGGDEFVVLLPDTNEENATLFRQRVKAELEDIDVASCCNTDSDLGISASIGIGFHTPGDDLEDLLKQADENMYKDKNRAQMSPAGPENRNQLIEDSIL